MADSFLSLPGSSGVISAGASVLGNLFNWWQTSEQRSYEREMQDRQWQLAREQWERENAYNMPSAQMARLRAAGINPHLAFANGDVMNQAASSPTVPDAHQVQPYTVNPLEASAIALNAAQSTKLLADAKKTGEETTGVTLDNFFKSFKRSIIESNEQEIRDAALMEVRAGSAANELQYYQAVYASFEVASLIWDLNEVEINGEQNMLLPLSGRPMKKEVADRLANLGLSEIQQRELERDLYVSFVKAQKKINEAAGAEATVDKILPEMIAKAPDWLQPILVIINRWLVDGKMPGFMYRPDKHTELHTHQDNSTRRTIINRAN